MLPPKPRLLTVMEVVDQQPTKTTKTDTRYPKRRSFERAVQSFVIYLVVASRFTDGTDPQTEDEAKGPPQAKTA